jgi:hypothetical protein
MSKRKNKNPFQVINSSIKPKKKEQRMHNQKVEIQDRPLRRACPNHSSNNQTKRVLALIINLG